MPLHQWRRDDDDVIWVTGIVLFCSLHSWLEFDGRQTGQNVGVKSAPLNWRLTLHNVSLVFAPEKGLHNEVSGLRPDQWYGNNLVLRRSISLQTRSLITHLSEKKKTARWDYAEIWGPLSSESPWKTVWLINRLKRSWMSKDLKQKVFPTIFNLTCTDALFNSSPIAFISSFYFVYSVSQNTITWTDPMRRM